MRLTSIALLLLLAGCSEDDQRYLLTYERPAAKATPQNLAVGSSSQSKAETATATLQEPSDVQQQRRESIASPGATPAPEPSPATASPAARPAVARAATPPEPPQVEAATAPTQSVPPIASNSAQVPEQIAKPEAPIVIQTPAAVKEPPSPPRVVATLRPSANADSDAHCRAVASQRKNDAAANGYDDDMQTQIFNGTLRDCIRWGETHR